MKSAGLWITGIILAIALLAWKGKALLAMWGQIKQQSQAQQTAAQQAAAETAATVATDQSETALQESKNALQAAQTQSAAQLQVAADNITAQTLVSNAWNYAVQECDKASTSSGGISILGVGGSESGGKGGCVSL